MTLECDDVLNLMREDLADAYRPAERFLGMYAPGNGLGAVGQTPFVRFGRKSV